MSRPPSRANARRKAAGKGSTGLDPGGPVGTDDACLELLGGARSEIHVVGCGRCNQRALGGVCPAYSLVRFRESHDRVPASVFTAGGQVLSH